MRCGLVVALLFGLATIGCSSQQTSTPAAADKSSEPPATERPSPAPEPDSSAGTTTVAEAETAEVVSVPDGSTDADAPPELLRGDQGHWVTELQRQLVLHGHTVEVDGIYGPATEAAVRDFQMAHGLAIDGIAGPDTWDALHHAEPETAIDPDTTVAPTPTGQRDPATTEPPTEAWDCIEYEKIDLGEGRPRDINNNGVIVGESEHGAVWWSSPTDPPVLLPVPSHAMAWSAIGINDHNQVLLQAGDWQATSDVVVLDLGTGLSTPMPPVEGAIIWPHGINDRGEVAVRIVPHDGDPHYVLVWNHTTNDIDTHPELAGLDVWVADINDLGHVAGGVERDDGRIAFYWDRSTATVHDVNVGGGTSASVAGINNVGQIVGDWFDEPDHPGHLTLWEHHAAEPTPFAVRWWNSVTDINDGGLVIGTSNHTGPSTSAWVSDSSDGRCIELPSYNASAIAINNAGQVIGTEDGRIDAEEPRRAVLWNPP